MYKSKLDLINTEIAIKLIKDQFEHSIANKLHLLRVSAPLFVEKNTGINDQLNGIEEAVSFGKDDVELEIVQSLAKWKRVALYRYGIQVGHGIYTDMNAIRKDEVLSPIHSLYVDQWDWELVIHKQDRTETTLRNTILTIYEALKEVDQIVYQTYPELEKKLPDRLAFISSYELEKQYPNDSQKVRENKIAKKHGAVFITEIGDISPSGERYDSRSPDYDDWKLNGDLIVWNETLNDALELSSMGIRVDDKSLVEQLNKTNQQERLTLYYHQMVLNNELPFTIGGGIGQSRMCMFFLEKKHIGEVQSSYWTKDIIEMCKKENIFLL
jgi:aspartate--ammonia ligase